MLTIDQLKALKVGEWVWIKQGEKGCYAEIQYSDENGLNVVRGKFCYWMNYSDYGTKWVAHKNKEEAEGKSITLPYLLCTSSKFACVIWRDKDGRVHKTYTMPIDEAKGVLKEKEKLQNGKINETQQ